MAECFILADSKDTSFTYMLHPVTNTPIFAHVDMLEPGRHDKEELRCFYAAQYEMVKLRPIFGLWGVKFRSNRILMIVLWRIHDHDLHGGIMQKIMSCWLCRDFPVFSLQWKGIYTITIPWRRLWTRKAHMVPFLHPPETRQKNSLSEQSPAAMGFVQLPVLT